jgi:hypothetical protein
MCVQVFREWAWNGFRKTGNLPSKARAAVRVGCKNEISENIRKWSPNTKARDSRTTPMSKKVTDSNSINQPRHASDNRQEEPREETTSGVDNDQPSSATKIATVNKPAAKP